MKDSDLTHQGRQQPLCPQTRGCPASGEFEAGFDPQLCVYEHLRMVGGGGDLGFLPVSFMLSHSRTERKTAGLGDRLNAEGDNKTPGFA